LKIGQYLAKLWTKLCGLLFWATLYSALWYLFAVSEEIDSSAVRIDYFVVDY